MKDTGRTELKKILSTYLLVFFLNIAAYIFFAPLVYAGVAEGGADIPPEALGGGLIGCSKPLHPGRPSGGAGRHIRDAGKLDKRRRVHEAHE